MAHKFKIGQLVRLKRRPLNRMGFGGVYQVGLFQAWLDPQGELPAKAKKEYRDQLEGGPG